MDRREFIRTASLAGVGIAAASCARGISGGDDSPALPGRPMDYRTNPGNGDVVSLLGYGCMRWQTLTDKDGSEVIDQESVNELVDLALEAGVNYFDSAPMYLHGQSERASALALLRHPRESYFIATKCSNFRDHSREAGIRMYRTSLERFETDHIDYYLLHSLADGAGFKERFVDNGLMDFFLEERKAGRIRNLGFSFHGDAAGLEEMLAFHGKYHWDFVQIQMNYADWKHAGKAGRNADRLYGMLAEMDIPVVIMEPLLGGRLASLPDVLADRLKDADGSRSVASWAFRFAGSFPKVLTVLSGMTYREHLEDNLSTFCGFESLGEEAFRLLEEVAGTLAAYPMVGCTTCQYCMPCPYGINIPGIFAHYNKCVNEGMVQTLGTTMESWKDAPVGGSDGSREGIDPGVGADEQNAWAERTTKLFRQARRRYLSGYDKAVPSYRQADHCIGCGKCKAKCPQKIDIPARLREIDRFVESLKSAR